MSEIRNIHHLEAINLESLDFTQGLANDMPRMLAMLALGSKLHERQRSPVNAHITMLGHEGGIRAALSVLKLANKSPISPDSIEEGVVYQEKLWIGAQRLNAHELAGSVVVQGGVSIFDEQGKRIINNGILVEAVTTPSKKAELATYYEAGIVVAEDMASDGEIVFSIESAENLETRQRRISNWINGELKQDPDIHQSIFANDRYAFKLGPLTVMRSDFGNRKPVPAMIYSNVPIRT